MNRVDQRDIDRRKLEIEEIVTHAVQSSRTSGYLDIPRNRRLAWFKEPESNQKNLVLLDPKDYGNNPDDPAGYKVYERVRELALELRSFHETADPIPNTLSCRGWYEDQATAQFYLIFHLPPECEMPSVNTRIRTLREMYKKSRPSVGARIELSRSLADTILQVHRRGWMHKGIRSDNILFFSRTPSSWPDLGKPRLAGFDYARRDSPHEYSENPINKDANLYRHPDALQDPTTSFTKRHDHYSLGVVMIEIACWKAIEDLFAHLKEFQGEECKEDDIQKIQGMLLGKQGAQGNLNDVAFRTGSIYAKVVEVCLKGDFGADDGEELYECFQRRVVRELDRCVI